MTRKGSVLALVAEWVVLFLQIVVGIGFVGVLLGMAGVALVPDVQAQLAAHDAPGIGVILPLLAAAAAFMALFSLLLIRLRRVLASVVVGDPFNATNPGNLRWVAGLLAAMEIAGQLISWLAPHRSGSHDGPGFELTPWLSVLIVLVLAEVFREGTRLRAEAELTV